MKDKKAKYLILDSTEIHTQLYEIKREFAFNDWSNTYIPTTTIDAKEIFEKYNIPEEFQKIIIKINIPFFIKSEAEEYTMGFPFDITAGKIEKENNDKYITATNYPIFYDNQVFYNKTKFRTKLNYLKFDDVIRFLQELDERKYLKAYLQSIKEFFDISIDLDLLFQSWEQSQKNPKKALKLYKTKIFPF